MNITTTERDGKHYGTVRQGDRIVFQTPGYLTQSMALADARCWVAFHGKGDMRKAYKLNFAGKHCKRCDGNGYSTHWGLSRNTCFSCKGAGFFFSAAGKEAREAYDKAMRAAFIAPFGSLSVGDRFRLLGSDKWFTIDTERDLKLFPATEKIQRDVPGRWTEIMHEIAAQYPEGCWLEVKS